MRNAPLDPMTSEAFLEWEEHQTAHSLFNRFHPHAIQGVFSVTLACNAI
jgi:hypothetical protein